jgi:NAD(P)-dependent dehydrogenase (short-subunit alcohol dehydrogenase family)
VEHPLADRVALVTGATSGIGRATALMLAELGADIAFTYRTSETAGELLAALGSAPCRQHGVKAELASVADVAAVVPDVVRTLGRVDILVNAAGITDYAELLDQTVEQWDRVHAVNGRAPFLLTQDAARAMIAQGDGGRIVNVSSSSAFRAEFAPPAYVSSKGGLNALTRSAAGALGRHGINVNAIVPGITATPMVTATFATDGAVEQALREGPLRNLVQRISQPEDVAVVIAFLCRPESRQITGQLIHVNGGSIV